ncbi:hypothetical protein Q1695_010287 [Nippostrongylus brasiliensis]|nr:hypothetical protein Q1695_010287 [Nippostrongylus brasiliensis]
MLLLLLLLTVSGVLSQLRDCPPFPVPKVGDIFYTSKSPSSSYPTLTMASLVCNEGFPFGQSFSSCWDSTWYPPELGTCPSSTPAVSAPAADPSPAGGCPMVGAPARGNVMYSNGLTVPMVPNGTNATLNCTFGPLEGISTMTCNNGSWIPDRFGQCPNATVSAEGCVDLPVPQGGQLIYSTAAVGGRRPTFTTVQLQCQTGTPSNGAITAACISNAWAPSALGTCGAMDDNSGASYCSPLQAPAEGSILLSKGTLDFPVQSGVVAQLRCAAGKYAVGSTTIMCSGGMWVPSSLGTCMDMTNTTVMGTCEWVTPPPGIYLSWSNITVGLQIQSGTRVTANCTSGTAITGNSELTCTNGRWIPPTFGTCAGAPGATAGAPCKPLTPSPNMGLIYRTDDRYRMGTVTQNLDHGTVLTVKCFNGTLSGPRISTCADGKWYPTDTISCGP